MNLYSFKRKLVIARRIARMLDRIATVISDAMVNVVYYHGKLGTVWFELPGLEHLETQDGIIVLRQLGDRQMVEIPFWCENRWALRRGRINGRMLNDIMSQALLKGLQPAYIVWKGKQMQPYNVAALRMLSSPDERVLPPERRWTEKQLFPQYGKDPLAHNSAILQRS